MNGEEIITSTGDSASHFDRIKHTDENGIEFWYGRELGVALGYASWDGFQPVIQRAEVSIKRSGLLVENHVRHVSNMVTVGYGNPRSVSDVKLTRYACYIVAQNGNAAKKPLVAQAQSYFAAQTRKQEIAEQYDADMKRLAIRQDFSESDKRISGAILEQNIHPRGLGIIKKEGDRKFFGGKTANEVKEGYGITRQKAPWVDRAPNVVVAAKTLANELTATNIEKYGISGFPAILDENNSNNESVRKTVIERRGVEPESELPVEDITKVKQRVKKLEKLGMNSSIDEIDTSEKSDV